MTGSQQVYTEDLVYGLHLHLEMDPQEDGSPCMHAPFSACVTLWVYVGQMSREFGNPAFGQASWETGLLGWSTGCHREAWEQWRSWSLMCLDHTLCLLVLS